MCHLVQLTSSCNQPNYFNQHNDHRPWPVQIHQKNYILDLPKDSKLTFIFNLLKVSKITSLRISIFPVMEELQKSKLSSSYIYLCSLEIVSAHSSGLPYIGCFRVDDEVWLLWSVTIYYKPILKNSNLHSWNFHASFFAHLIFMQTKKSTFHAQLIFAHF